MFSIIITAHGTLATAFKQSIRMIYGETSQVYSVNFEDGENADTLKMKLLEVIEKNGLQEVLVLTDIFSGTPFNAASMIAFTRKNVKVVAGANLPICLEAVANQQTETVYDFVSRIIQIAPDTIKPLNDLITVSEGDDLL